MQFTGWKNSTGNNGSTGVVISNSINGLDTSATPTSSAGTNSFNKVYGNTIQQCQTGIALVGFNTTTGVGSTPDPILFLGNIGNDIGGTNATTGNTILNQWRW